MNYESPMEVFVKEATDTMEKNFDNEIILVLKRDYGIRVDADELLKALTYDRDQYHKGFVDGVNEVTIRLADKELDLLADCNSLNSIAGTLRHMGYNGMSDVLLTIESHIFSIIDKHKKE